MQGLPAQAQSSQHCTSRRARQVNAALALLAYDPQAALAVPARRLSQEELLNHFANLTLSLEALKRKGDGLAARMPAAKRL